MATTHEMTFSSEVIFCTRSQYPAVPLAPGLSFMRNEELDIRYP